MLFWLYIPLMSGLTVGATNTQPTPTYIATTSQGKQSITLSPSTPKNASRIIDLSFAGFAFEQADFYWYAFDEQGKVNTFSQNLINNIADRTGGAPFLRVGGTSGDYGRYNASQKAFADPPTKNTRFLINSPYLSLGPSYFNAFKNFPGAQYIFQVPLALNDLNNTMQFAAKGLNVIGSNLQALEIGNEPTLYPDYDINDYIDRYKTFETALANSSLLPSRGPIFQALDTSWGKTSMLSVPDAFNLGINDEKRIKTVAYHYYQSKSKQDGLPGLQSRIANHSAVVQGLSWFKPFTQYLQQNAPDIAFTLSEVANAIAVSDVNQRNNLATCLWNIDFQLQAMVINVTRVNMQSLMYPGFHMWVPVSTALNTPPQVRANYYSQPFVAEFIGPSNSTRVAEYPSSDPDKVAVYAAYDHDTLARIAIVNFDLWQDGMKVPGTKLNKARPKTSITIAGLPKSVRGKTVTAHFLSAPGGAYATKGITWRGLQWTYASKGKEVRVKNDNVVLKVSQDGKVVVPVQGTSAVMLTMGTS